MRVALDTNRYVDFAKGVPEAVERISKSKRVFVPVVTLAELRAGFSCGTKCAENERRLIEFVDSARVEILHIDEGTTHHYASLFRQLRRQGTPIPTNDIWMAALVIQNGLRLYARDAHFDHLPQLPRV